MATFNIYEDIENIPPLNKIYNGDKNIKNIVGKKNFFANKTKFQPVTNNFSQEPTELTVENDDKGVCKNLKPNIVESCLQINKVNAPKLEKEKEFFPVCLLHSHEYKKEIWEYMKNLEINSNEIRPDYMTKQVAINWHTRSVLIDWLASVADEYKFSDETFHLSVNYIDRFLSQISVVRAKFQLVGAAAMMVATKMEEYYPVDSKEWSYLTGNTFTPRQVLKMEQFILKVLRFRTQPPTINRFIKHLCAEYEMGETVEYLAMYISDLVLVEGNGYLNYFPSKLAAAAIVLARCLTTRKNPWPSKLEKVCGYTLRELSPVVQRQHKTFKDSPLKEQQAVQTRYKNAKYNKVALMKPKVLILEEYMEE